MKTDKHILSFIFSHHESPLTLINNCGLNTILFPYLQNELSDKQKNEIISLEKASAVLEQYQCKTIHALVSALNLQCITPVFFKGVFLSKKLYSNPYTRPKGDIDLWINEQDFLLGLTTLTQLGYKIGGEDGINNQHHIALFHNSVKNGLELHKDIIAPRIGIDCSYLKNHLTSFALPNTHCITFDLTATFLHLLYHIYMDACIAAPDVPVVDQLRTLPNTDFFLYDRFLFRSYEIALYSEKFTSAIKWSEIEDDIKKQPLNIIFKNVIISINNLFPHTFPTHFLKLISNINYL